MFIPFVVKFPLLWKMREQGLLSCYTVYIIKYFYAVLILTKLTVWKCKAFLNKHGTISFHRKSLYFCCINKDFHSQLLLSLLLLTYIGKLLLAHRYGWLFIRFVALLTIYSYFTLIGMAYDITIICLDLENGVKSNVYLQIRNGTFKIYTSAWIESTWHFGKCDCDQSMLKVPCKVK